MKPLYRAEHIRLPAGWSLEPWQRTESFLLIRSPERTIVTVDFGVRGWRLGGTITGRLRNNLTFRGRGWQQNLVDAAIRDLSTVDMARGAVTP